MRVGAGCAVYAQKAVILRWQIWSAHESDVVGLHERLISTFRTPSKNRCGIMAQPPRSVVKRGDYTWCSGRWNYPQRRGTRPSYPDLFFPKKGGGENLARVKAVS